MSWSPAGCARRASRWPSTARATCSAGRPAPTRRRPRSGPDRTSTPRPTAGASTAPWASSPASTSPRRSGPPAAPGARSPSWRSGWRRGPGSGAASSASRALFGELEPDEAELVDADGVTLGQAFAALGLGESLPSGPVLDRRPACFVEAHIEQGPSLAAQGAPLGLVTSIAGMAGIELVFTGRRGHAGTVPMALRSDALAAAAGFVRRVHDAAAGAPRRRGHRRPDGRVARRDEHDPGPGRALRRSARARRGAAPGADRHGDERRRRRGRRGLVPGRHPAALALRARADAPRARRCPSPGDRRRRGRAGGAALRRRARRRDPRHGGRALGDALRPQRRRRREPCAGGVDGRRCRCRWRSRCSRLRSGSSRDDRLEAPRPPVAA